MIMIIIVKVKVMMIIIANSIKNSNNHHHHHHHHHHHKTTTTVPGFHTRFFGRASETRCTSLAKTAVRRWKFARPAWRGGNSMGFLWELYGIWDLYGNYTGFIWYLTGTNGNIHGNIIDDACWFHKSPPRWIQGSRWTKNSSRGYSTAECSLRTSPRYTFWCRIVKSLGSDDFRIGKTSSLAVCPGICTQTNLNPSAK